MPLHRTSQKPTFRPPPVAAARSAGQPIATDAAAFQSQHGDPATWTADEFEVYLDLAVLAATPRLDGVVR